MNYLTKRLLFQAGDKFTGKAGDEGGWIDHSTGKFSSPPVLGTDANYYNRALWTFQKL